ncbi:MAG: hypothetical protein M3041_18725 [Acidobacteriota bacterium]|nr:hypothetical protein [Acidobacteriota bacterium]
MDISQLPDDSRIWIFGISPALDARQSSRLFSVVDQFLDVWSAHGEPIVSGRDIVHRSFLVIGVDQRSETSGCSIDRMFGLLRQLESELDVAILDPNRIFCRDASGSVTSVSRRAFSERGRGDTVVFDILAERIGKIRGGDWEKPARNSWHKALLENAG